MKEPKFKIYPKIYTFGKEENESIFSNKMDEIVIEEKIDGSNFRYMIKDGKIIFGSRNRGLGDETHDIGGNWKRCVEHIKDKVPRDKPELEGKIIFGECCVSHTLSYDWEHIPPYLGFDIYDMGTDKMLGYDEKIALFKKMGLDVVPLVKIVKAGEIKEVGEDSVPRARYCSPSAKIGEMQAEGIVFKNYRTQIMAKYVREKFKEDNRKTFGGGKKHAEDDTARLMAIYCTNTRIEKCVFKLIDEGEKLEMTLMHKLPKMVLEDVYEENWREICFSSWSINFQTIKKKMGRRCVEVLKNMIVNSGLNNNTGDNDEKK